MGDLVEKIPRYDYPHAVIILFTSWVEMQTLGSCTILPGSSLAIVRPISCIQLLAGRGASTDYVCNTCNNVNRPCL